MNQKERFWLALSIIVSITIWGAIYNWKFGLVLVISLLIHEFGHYRQMGIEGISKRTMFMLPPLGAIALSKEPWPTRLAETKIALAGPLWGAIPVLALLFWWHFIQPLPFFAASAAIIACANLFNLALPVAVLDGGRVIKSVLFSWRPALGLMFYSMSIVVLLTLVFLSPSLFPIALLLLFALNGERRSYLYAQSELTKIRQRMVPAEEVRQYFTEADAELRKVSLQLNFVHLRELEKNLQLIAEPFPMMGWQIVAGLAAFIAMGTFYIWIISSVIGALGIKGDSASDPLSQLFHLVL